MPTEIKKIAIIVGHGSGDGGADCWNKQTEFNYNSMVAELLKEESTGKEMKVFYRGKSGILGVGHEVTSWNPDMSIELHLNAFDGTAHGCEVLCLEGDDNSATIATSFISSFTKIFGRKNRGIKFLGNRERGAINLASVKSVKQSILVEPFFCDNNSEWIDSLTYSKFLVEWIKGL